MPKVTFLPERVVIEVERGTTLLEAAKRAGARVGHACGGQCACSTCHVYVVRGLASLPEPDEREEDRLDQVFDVRPSSRLSCQTEVSSEDVEVEITPESRRAWLDEHPEEARA